MGGSTAAQLHTGLSHTSCFVQLLLAALPDQEREAMARLAVFPESFSTESAAHVLGLPGGSAQVGAMAWKRRHLCRQL